MSINSFIVLLRIARDLPKFLSKPVSYESAVDAVRSRLDSRNELFLELAKTSIYGCSYSPYRQLLLNSGCEYGDLCHSVRSHGLETTLSKLYKEGVRLSLEEFKSQSAIHRGSLIIRTQQTDYDNIESPYRSISRKSSGSRSQGTDTNYSWHFIAEEAETESLLYRCHEVTDFPLALWYPSHLSMAGIHNLLMNLKCHRPPEKWYSQTKTMDLRERLMMVYLALCCRKLGLKVPMPEYVPLTDAVQIALWMARTKKLKGTAVLRTYSSSGVRVVKAALKHDLDIEGTTIFVGGEPLTKESCRFMSSAGVRVLRRYVSTETGLIAASCSSGENADAMHVYTDRLVVIPDNEANTLLFTTILPDTPKVLFNTDLGDTGLLQDHECKCPFGELGMDLFVSQVHSSTKQTLEGMSIFLSELDSSVGQIIREYGGTSEDFQFWEKEGDQGLNRLTIVISPAVKNLDEGDFVNQVLTRLGNYNLRCQLATDLWRQSDTISFLREEPRPSVGQKILRLIPDPRL